LVTIILTVLHAAKLSHRVYDVVTEPVSKAEAAAIVKKLIPDAEIELDMNGAFGEERPPEQMTQRAWEKPRLTQDFDYRQKYSFEGAVTDYIQMAQANQFKW
jgi:nucleoside-diphosphate-sugar epimerase